MFFLPWWPEMYLFFLAEEDFVEWQYQYYFGSMGEDGFLYFEDNNLRDHRGV